MKIWICICLLFFVHSVVILQDERFEVVYSLDETDTNVTDSIFLLVCLKVGQIANYSNRTEIDLDQLASDLYRHLEQQFANRSKNHAKDRSKDHSNLNMTSAILDQISSRNYLFISDQVCIFTNNYRQQNKVHQLLGPDSMRMMFKEDSFNAFYMDPGSGVQQLNVYSMPAPYSDCSADAHSDYRSLYECFKSPNRFSKYYYRGEERGLVRTDYDDTVGSVVRHERDCFAKHMRNECRVVYFVPNVWRNKSKDEIKNIEAHPALSTFDYWCQLVGLGCLFVGVSIIDLSNKLIQLASSKIAVDGSEPIRFNTARLRSTLRLAKLINTWKIRRETIKSCLFFLRLAVLFAGLLFSLCLYTVMLLDYHGRIVNPITKQSITNLVRPEKMHLVICIGLEHISAIKIDLNASSSEDEFHNSNRTLSEIEADTEDGLMNSLVDLYQSFQHKAIPVDWSLGNRTLFRRDGNELSRCYQLTVRPSEPKFMQLISISKLVIKLRVPFRLYLLARRETFHSKSFHFLGTHSFYKKITRRQKSKRKGKCVDYEKIYLKNEKVYLNCRSRQGCVEGCSHRKFISRHRNITMGTYDHPLVIDRAFFSDYEWATSYLVEHKAAHANASDECEKLISRDEYCGKAQFLRYFNSPPDAANELTFDLYYDVVRTEEEQTSEYKLLLDVLNVQSIFFGLTAFRLLNILHGFVRNRLKLRKGKRIVLFGVYLICSAGFVWQVSHIFDLIINGELTYSQHYEVTKEVCMPESVFCFEVDKRLIDANHKLTGNYLERMASDLNAKRIFQNITYLDESNRLTEFRSVKSFFFVTSKCFSLALNMTYPRENFLFTIRNVVLRVQFRREFVEQLNAQGKRILFFTKTESALYFNKVLRLSYEGDRRSLSVVQMSYSLRYDWKFQLIRNPSALFFEETLINDSNAYLRKLARKFSDALDVATLNLFLKPALFDQEIRDDLFEVYFNQVQNKSDHSSPLNPNYERDFSVYHLIQERSADYKLLYLIYFFRKVVTTSQDNYAKLILSLLNTLSIWFDLVALDLANYLTTVNRFFSFLHNRLSKAKVTLSRLKARQLIN